MGAIVSNLAAVDPRAELEDDVEIGPFCSIGPHVKIGRGTRLEANVTVMGHVQLGAFNHIFPGAVIGGDPQDVSYRGSPTRVEIGSHNVIRECVTINRATEKEDGVTSLGDHNFLMASSHVAHDCRLGNSNIIANATLLGGHVRVADHVTISGAAAVHHFASVGRFSFISGMSRVLHDVPPFMLCDGQPTRPRCVNVVALKRRLFAAEEIDGLIEAHRLLYRAKVGLANAREILAAGGHITAHVEELLEFLSFQQGGRHGRGRDRRKLAA